jgi:hypothetical protein
MRQLIAVCFIVSSLALGEVRLARVARVPYGRGLPGIVLADSDHDSLGEVIYHTGSPLRWEILEYRPVNRYELVLSDTGTEWQGESIVSGNFVPWDAGDVDRDGKTDLVGEVFYADSVSYQKALCTIESRTTSSYPDSLNWYVEDPNSAGGYHPRQVCNLDDDSLPDIISGWGAQTAVFENVADDRESLVALVPHPSPFSRYQIDDYDLDGRKEFAFLWAAQVFIYKCTGDNRYEPACSLRVADYNVPTIFSGRDIDQNGRPEFFVVHAVPQGMGNLLLLYQVEAQSEHEYSYYLLDSAGVDYEMDVGRNLCTDLDGDGIEEIVWGCGKYVLVLKATGPHQTQQVGYWWNPEGGVTYCNAADYNRNGYPEVYVGGCPYMSVIEVEAVRVLSPNGGERLTPHQACDIRWRVLQPPRCDSVSLFLRSDTNTVNGFYRMDTIVTGLSPSESTYLWIPDSAMDSARIVAIAYGPGWQFDESDSAFSIVPVGVAGSPAAPPRDWALSVSPNPARGAFAVRYDVPRKTVVRVGLYDAVGRLAEEYASGELEPGRYHAAVRRALASGVYFCRLDNGEKRISRKVVLTE